MMEDTTIHVKNDKPKDNYFIHFWHEYWRSKKIDKDKEFDKDSIYEQLKSKYLFG